MTLTERIAAEAITLSPALQQQVLDFALFLKQKEQAKLLDDMNAIIDENLEAFQELAK